MMQFMAQQLLGLLLVLAFPQLALWLPQLMRNSAGVAALMRGRVRCSMLALARGALAARLTARRGDP